MFMYVRLKIVRVQQREKYIHTHTHKILYNIYNILYIFKYILYLI